VVKAPEDGPVQDSVTAVWWIFLQPNEIASNLIAVVVQWLVLAAFEQGGKGED
jgi:hypothetical protein